MTFDDFLAYVQREAGRNKSWTAGQTYLNLLNTVRPDLAKRVRGTRFDPSRDDANIPGFLTWAEMNWVWNV